MTNFKTKDIAKGQAELALSILDMVKEFSDNPDILEHVDCITFNLHEIFGDNIINWYSIGDICDSVAYSLRHDKPSQIESAQQFLDFTQVRAKAEYIAAYGVDKPTDNQ